MVGDCTWQEGGAAAHGGHVGAEPGAHRHGDPRTGHGVGHSGDAKELRGLRRHLHGREQFPAGGGT
eukprot:6026884-Pyramimonas_sp.AAC.1